MSDLNRTIGERVRALRGLHDVTQADLAASVGLSRTSITAIESGTQTVPLDRLAAIAERFGCPMSALLGETDLPSLPDVWIVTKCELHCALCGWLDEDLTPEEATSQRSAHLALHITYPDLGRRAAQDGAAVIPLRAADSRPASSRAR